MNNNFKKLYHIYDSAIIGSTNDNRIVYSVKRIKDKIVTDYQKFFNDPEKVEYISFQIMNLLIDSFCTSSKKNVSPVFLNDLSHHSNLDLF